MRGGYDCCPAIRLMGIHGVLRYYRYDSVLWHAHREWSYLMGDRSHIHDLQVRIYLHIYPSASRHVMDRVWVLVESYWSMRYRLTVPLEVTRGYDRSHRHQIRYQRPYDHRNTQASTWVSYQGQERVHLTSHRWWEGQYYPRYSEH